MEELSKSRKFLKFNISGQTFLVTENLFSSDPHCNFLSEKFLLSHWNESLDSFYLERDPAVFNALLNKFRYQSSAKPANLDEEMLKEEAEFWNVSLGEDIDVEEYDYKVMEEEFLWMEGRIPPPDDFASTSTKNRFIVWSFLSDPLGPHTPYQRASLVYATWSMIATFLYLTIYGLSTNLSFRISRNNDVALDDINCTTRIQCLAVSAPQEWITILNIILQLYFILETILKIACCTSYKHYFKSLINWIDILMDILVVLSIVFQLQTTMDTEISNVYATLRILFQGLQVFRIFRIFQYASVLDGLLVMILTIKASGKELSVLIFYMVMGMYFFSTLINLVELTAEIGKGVTDCLIGYWWAVITMTTVGYGDVSPASTLGYVVGILCALSGLILTAMPVAIIGNNFTIYWEHNQKRRKRRRQAENKLKSATGNKVDAVQVVEATKL